MKSLKFLFLFFFILAGNLSANFVFSAAFVDVVINEIAWMGTETSAQNEWIELYNNTDLLINLDGWVLKAIDGTPEINLTGVISAKGFYLLERTNDDTLPSVPADQIYTGALSNEGKKLELYDNAGNLVDSVDCSTGWFAGDNLIKKTMERTGSGGWQTSQNPGGTPKAKNSILPQPKLPRESSTELAEARPPLTSPTPPKSYEASPPDFYGLGVGLIAAFTAIFSGTIILILKTKFIAKRSK